MTKFKTDKEYYADRTLVSNSMLGRLLENEDLFDLWMNGYYKYEPTEPMAIGNVIHNAYFDFLNGEPLNQEGAQPIHVVPDYDLRSKAGKEIFAKIQQDYPKNEMILKESKFNDALQIVENMKIDDTLNRYFDDLRKKYVLRFEVPFIGDYHGVGIKGKADIVCEDLDGIICKIVDLKTTSSIGGFKGSVRKYGYNRQFAFYALLAGLPIYNEDIFDFAVIEKQTSRSQIYITDRKGFKDESHKALTYAFRKYMQYKKGDILSLKTQEL